MAGHTTIAAAYADTSLLAHRLIDGASCRLAKSRSPSPTPAFKMQQSTNPADLISKAGTFKPKG
jgi:hypothetical protein